MTMLKDKSTVGSDGSWQSGWPKDSANCELQPANSVRATLLAQIARLEKQLAEYPRAHAEVRPRAALQDVAELEVIRDGMAARLTGIRRAAEAEAERHDEARLLIEAMLTEPAAYPYVRVSREDIGEKGCGGWHVLPRFGIVGAWAGWWRVKISSGCPLAGRLAAATTRRPGGPSAARRCVCRQASGRPGALSRPA